jgi:hypothetical protein
MLTTFSGTVGGQLRQVLLYIVTFKVIDFLVYKTNSRYGKRSMAEYLSYFYEIKIFVYFVHCWYFYVIYSVIQRHVTTPTALAQLHTVNSATASYHAIVLMHFYAVNSAANISAVKMELERTPILTPSISAIVFEILISFPWQRNTNEQQTMPYSN